MKFKPNIGLWVNLSLWTLCACQAKERRTQDDTVVVLVDAVHRDLDPRFSLTSHDTKLSRLIAPGLTTVNTTDLKPKLELASSLQQLSPLVWEAEVREGILFSDGSALGAADVAYTFESVMGTTIDSLHRQSFQTKFAKVEAIDDKKVRFTLNEPLATIWSDLDFGIVSKKVATSIGGSFKDGGVVGAGVYQLERFVEDNVLLTQNPYYYGTKPAIPKVLLRTVRDANARNLMMVGGSADLTQNSVRPDLVDYVQKNPRVAITSGKSAVLTYMMMNNVDAILKDVRVRKALAYALDRQKIVDVKISGRATLATGLLPPGHWAYEGDVERYAYDPERAMQLLDDAGYPDPDGPGGEPRLRLSYKTSANQFRLAVARVIASQLGEVGIDVEVRTFEFGTFFADIKEGNFQLAAMDTSPISEPDFYYTYFHSERIPTPKNPHLHNRWRYRNARVDALTILGRHDANIENRKKVYSEIQQILSQQLPVLPLWHLDNIAVMNASLDGYEVLPNASFANLPRVTKQAQ